MTSTLVRAGDKTVARKAVMIIGEPSTMKTLLASTAPGILFLDAEARAEHTKKDRLVPPQDAKGFDAIANDIKTLKSCKYDPSTMSFDYEALLLNGLKVKTVVLDTVDRLQEFCRQKNESGLRGNVQRFYGDLYTQMMHECIWPLLSLPINIILVCHSREYQAEVPEVGGKKIKVQQYPTIGLELEGKIKDKLLNYFDVILHLTRKQNGDRLVITDSTIIEGRYYRAKDKTNAFEGKTISFDVSEEGVPDVALMTQIFESMTGKAEAKAKKDQEMTELRGKVREAWLAHAILKGVMVNETDADGGALVKKHVMAPLNDRMKSITAGKVKKLIVDGKALIDKIPVEKAEDAKKTEE